jgi:raffinose/stachyose/melibiose transport system substrate-binding protein
MRHPVRVAAALVALAAATTAATGCGSSGSGGTTADGVVVITCEACPSRPTKADAFDAYRKELMDAFNKRYRGRYEVKSALYKPANDADSAQHYARAAVTDTLPDLFTDQSNVVLDVARTGKLMDFTPYLARDAAWRSSFLPDAFTSLTSQDRVWGIPEQRDVVGIFYNKALFERAGIASFPTTWAQLGAACRKLAATGVIPFAMDGDWVTQLMWANLIGTQPGGRAFLTEGIKNGDYASNPAVVRATEALKQLHTSGCVNKDAFSGDYNRAAAPFLAGQAAMIANGPWMAADIKGADKKLDVGYAPSPGSGLIVIPGSAGWASGAKDDAHREAVAAFMKFMTSDPQMLRKAEVTGSYWPTKEQPTAAQIKQLEPLSFNLLKQVDRVAYTYPHAKFATPQSFTTTWINDWPAYVQGDMSTEDFLGALSDSLDQQR